MRVYEAMTTKLRTIGPEDSVVTANELMWRYKFHHLVVVETRNDVEKIVGILSAKDLGGDEPGEIPDNQQVKEIMSTDVALIGAEDSLTDAKNMLDGRKVGSLPVVDENGKLVGILTRTDLENINKRGRSHGPYQGDDGHLEPYVPLHRRGGGKSKYHHTEMPAGGRV